MLGWGAATVPWSRYSRVIVGTLPYASTGLQLWSGAILLLDETKKSVNRSRDHTQHTYHFYILAVYTRVSCAIARSRSLPVPPRLVDAVQRVRFVLLLLDGRHLGALAHAKRIDQRVGGRESGLHHAVVRHHLPYPDVERIERRR